MVPKRANIYMPIFDLGLSHDCPDKGLWVSFEGVVGPRVNHGLSQGVLNDGAGLSGDVAAGPSVSAHIEGVEVHV